MCVRAHVCETGGKGRQDTRRLVSGALQPRQKSVRAAGGKAGCNSVSATAHTQCRFRRVEKR